MRKMLLLVIGAFVLLTIGAWYFFHEVLIIWIAVLFNFIKGITLKSILFGLAALLYRFLLVEIPKRALLFLAFLGLPRRMRLKLEARTRLFRLRVLAFQEYLIGRYTWLQKRHVALVFAIVVSIVAFVVGALYFGVYFVWFVGGDQVVRAARWALRFFWVWSQNFAFRTVMFAKVSSAWNWALNKLPGDARSRYRQLKYRFTSRYVRRRRAITRWTEDRIRQLRTKGQKQPNKMSDLVPQEVEKETNKACD